MKNNCTKSLDGKHSWRYPLWEDSIDKSRNTKYQPWCEHCNQFMSTEKVIDERLPPINDYPSVH